MRDIPLPSLSKRLRELTPDQRRLLRERLSQRRLSVPAYLARLLAQRGIDYAYGIPGLPIYGFFRDCGQAGMRLVATRHQQAAVMASSAYNYTRGILSSIAVVSPGPATTNALTGVLNARENAWPLLLIGGFLPRPTAGVSFRVLT